MVRKTRAKQYADDEDISATQQSVIELQEQIADLATAVAALTARQAAPALPRRNDQISIHDNSDEDDENPFAPLRQPQKQQRPRRRINNNSDSEEEANESSWKSSFKLELPVFNGSTNAEELLDWFVTIEEILEFREISLNRFVPLVAIRFRDRAAAWWSQVKTTRARLGKSKITTWDKLKREMQKKISPVQL